MAFKERTEPITQQKKSDAIKKLWRDPVYRAKMEKAFSLRQKKAWQDPSFVKKYKEVSGKKQGVKMKEVWSKDGYRDKLSKINAEVRERESYKNNHRNGVIESHQNGSRDYAGMKGMGKRTWKDPEIRQRRTRGLIVAVKKSLKKDPVMKSRILGSTKEYYIVSPTGTRYRTIYLKGWCKNNIHLFEDTRPESMKSFLDRVRSGLSGSYTTGKKYQGWIIMDRRNINENTNIELPDGWNTTFHMK